MIFQKSFINDDWLWRFFNHVIHAHARSIYHVISNRHICNHGWHRTRSGRRTRWTRQNPTDFSSKKPDFSPTQNPTIFENRFSTRRKPDRFYRVCRVLSVSSVFVRFYPIFRFFLVRPNTKTKRETKSKKYVYSAVLFGVKPKIFSWKAHRIYVNLSKIPIFERNSGEKPTIFQKFRFEPDENPTIFQKIRFQPDGKPDRVRSGSDRKSKFPKWTRYQYRVFVGFNPTGSGANHDAITKGIASLIRKKRPRN